MAQFEDHGALQIVKATESSARVTATKTGASAGGGIPPVAHGQATTDRTTTLDERDAAERTYDPLWTNAQRLLDYLESADLIHRDLATARIGQFVLVSGELSMLQMTLLKDLLGGPNFKEKTIGIQISSSLTKLLGAPDTTGAKMNKTAVAKQAKQAREAALVALEVMAMLPHSAQATLAGKGASVWCALSENWLIPAPSDITLKYGSLVMTGEWHALGILDATPSPIPPHILTPASDVPHHYGPAVRNISNLARTLLGRPAEAYGITPLLIFRSIVMGQARI